jgi:ATP-dependent helicase HrpA
LYGLVVYSQRRIHYGVINPKEAREIFIRDALVGGDFETRAPFFAYNHKLIREIENLEHKSRRVDVLVDDALIAAFYDKLIPADICNGITFEKWHKEVSVKTPKLLYLNRDDLMRHEAAGVTTDLFPKQMTIAGIEMALTYHFEPGAVRDGVTLTVPLYTLNQVPAERCEWLVPGMLKEKVHLLLKSLPQKLRRHCVPLPDYAAGFCDRVQEASIFGRGSLIDAVIVDIREQLTQQVKTTDFKSETLPAHHSMNFKVIDEHGRQLDMGRNLAALQAEFGGKARESFQRLADKTTITSTAPVATPTASGNKPTAQAKSNSPSQAASQLENLTTWSFGELPELLEIQQGKQTLIGFPALVDKGAHCNVEVFDDPNEAARIHRIGMRRLMALQMKEQLKFLEKNVPGLQQMGMQFMALGSQEELRDQIIDAGLERAFLQEPLPKNAKEFDARRDEGKTRLGLLVNEIGRLAGLILAEYHPLPKKLQGIKVHAQAAQDMQSQLQSLVSKRFIADNDYANLTHFPRYLKAMSVRLDKLRADAARDARSMSEWAQVATPWQRAQKDKQGARNADPKMVEFRWLLEELRVSLFAQELRTPMPVSVKRLQKVWESMQR